MKTAQRRSPVEWLKLATAHYTIQSIYLLMRTTYRLAYGLRIIGAEHVPTEGPAIMAASDSQSLGAVLAEGIALIGLLKPFFERENSVLYMHEELAAKVFTRFPMRTRVHALRPQSSRPGPQPH